MKEYHINDIVEIARSIKTGDPVENDIGTVIDGFFWFPDEIQWAVTWQKEQEQDSPNGYFAMLLDPDIFKDEIEAVVEGSIKDDTFFANKLFAKCPTKYEDEKLVDSGSTIAQ